MKVEFEVYGHVGKITFDDEDYVDDEYIQKVILEIISENLSWKRIEDKKGQ